MILEREEYSTLAAEDVVGRLAARLYLKMERMDPSGRGPWDSLTENDQEFYRASIREILLEKTLLKRAITDSSDSPTTTA